MKSNDLTHMLDFLDVLRRNDIRHVIEHASRTALTVHVVRPDVWLEVDFHADRLKYMVFRGDAVVRKDLDELQRLLTRPADPVPEPEDPPSPALPDMPHVTPEMARQAQLCIKLLQDSRFRK